MHPFIICWCWSHATNFPWSGRYPEQGIKTSTAHLVLPLCIQGSELKRCWRGRRTLRWYCVFTTVLYREYIRKTCFLGSINYRLYWFTARSIRTLSLNPPALSVLRIGYKRTFGTVLSYIRWLQRRFEKRRRACWSRQCGIYLSYSPRSEATLNQCVTSEQNVALIWVCVVSRSFISLGWELNIFYPQLV